ncbi:MAG: 50S ribosomal protein L18a [Theionarchaea archaeon]|nr:50S ribosomal protein L18a [Theionarchaea archaeon]
MESKKKIEKTTKEKKKKTKLKKLKKLKMKEFRVSGKFMMGSTLQKFKKEVRALSEKRAREKIYQDLGSKHRVRRSRVLITTVEEIP